MELEHRPPGAAALRFPLRAHFGRVKAAALAVAALGAQVEAERRRAVGKQAVPAGLVASAAGQRTGLAACGGRGGRHCQQRLSVVDQVDVSAHPAEPQRIVQ
eukprot:1278325-Prymnesium_polylepis.1